MSDQTYQIIAIAFYMAVMLGIGYVAFRRTSNIDDYMLAGRGLKPWVAALSAGASDMSGWLLMGLPGAIYLGGLHEAWIAIGLLIGAWANWKFVAPRLRSYTAISQNAITIPSFFEKRLKDRKHLLRIASAVIILVFFTFYVSSGMVAAGKFFEASFGWPYLNGMIFVAVITLLYTLFGGFLGASLTDVAQGLLMFTALIAVPIVAVIQMGDFGSLASKITEVNPEAFNLFSSFSGSNWFLAVVAIFSTAAWGLGYFGQPHIIVRFMALRSPGEAKTARRIGIGWMFLASAGAIATALVGVAYFADEPLTDASSETVFLLLSQIFFHPLIAGLVLAAVLAAIMSTMSSQLIVCSSALVEDLYNITGRKASPKALVMLGRTGVLIVAVIATLLALSPSSSILDLVSFAWAGFGGSFGPIVLLALYWRKLTALGGFAGMVSGAAVVYIWGNIDVLASNMYEIVPGFIVSLVVAWLVSRATFKPNAEIDAEFTAMEEELGAKVTA
ncbi:sodium/proline symporter PutP [Arthrobacter sp. MYb211]|uniref:sodium/proline symporter PutP n=1 Tax=Micrococcaceae TaxID=1268 RepID=UPI000CFB7829|nr:MULTISPECIES: sodium/proline symporter PutP [unclassified Arthrobacter]PQZ96839.1 sodium/proline symporter PutP [Arthrobacter sp. MYb224]PQZ98029.1 sodium/proline symporter PutP [Arthrobacter sp. MYb229]PRA10042.1 sodium/proline symporter PutP [Arthrobacter sp. MYb221]PRB46911.1 sodium/proline symporter PutP [Arthrobacter sp. MYb216]PRC05233.1 sodium/proline symporter PutP [Arthrobacter sp. MYb211]